MDHFLELFHTRRARAAMAALATVAGFATALYVGVAVAQTFTLQVGKNAKVTNQSGSTASEGIVVTTKRRAVYTLTGDSKAHPKCIKANGCFSFWPPVTVPSAKKLAKAAGVPGKPGVWHRDGFFQVTLNGHPLYRFAPDNQRDDATGEGIVSFGGTWHVVKDPSSGAGSGSPLPGRTTATTTTSTRPTTTTTTAPLTATTTTTTCSYPPCY